MFERNNGCHWRQGGETRDGRRGPGPNPARRRQLRKTSWAFTGSHSLARCPGARGGLAAGRRLQGTGPAAGAAAAASAVTRRAPGGPPGRVSAGRLGGQGAPGRGRRAADSAPRPSRGSSAGVGTQRPAAPRPAPWRLHPLWLEPLQAPNESGLASGPGPGRAGGERARAAENKASVGQPGNPVSLPASPRGSQGPGVSELEGQIRDGETEGRRADAGQFPPRLESQGCFCGWGHGHTDVPGSEQAP